METIVEQSGIPHPSFQECWSTSLVFLVTLPLSTGRNPPQTDFILRCLQSNLPSVYGPVQRLLFKIGETSVFFNH